METRSPKRRTGLRDWFVAVVVLEAVSLVIGLVMPVTPSKTGARTGWRPASFITPDPTYLESATGWFVFTNIVFVLLGLMIYLAVVRRRA